ncbi:hypothetical protein GF377_05265 [candidate division GN15 bacterium]|nr:hypothetical protein [candidate division GN15 bacterium]
MFSYSQIDELLQDTAMLVEEMAKLDEAAARVNDISQRIAEVYMRLKPKHEELHGDLEQLGRLQEVLRNYVFLQSQMDGSQLGKTVGSDHSTVGQSSYPQPHVLRPTENRPST